MDSLEEAVRNSPEGQVCGLDDSGAPTTQKDNEGNATDASIITKATSVVEVNNSGVCQSIKDKEFVLQKFTSTGKLTKQFSLNPDGSLHKTAMANMSTGEASSETIKVSEFAGMLDGLSDRQAIAISNHKYTNTIQITTARTQDPADNILSRTKEHFPFDRGLGLICFDFDFDENNPDLSIDEARKVLRVLIPETKPAAMLGRYSSSSFIKQISTGKFLTENKGLHLYCWTRHLKGMNELGDKLLHRAWRNDMGYLKISSAGSILKRCVIDTSVFSPERLIFEASPIMGDDLVREAPESVFFDGGVLDLKSTAGRKISATNKNKVTQLQDEVANKPEFKKEQETIRAAYLEKEADKICKKNSKLSHSDAMLVIEARKTSVLMPDDVLIFDDMGEVSAREVINNPLAYNMKSLADPIEPEKGRCKAKFYANADTGNPQIHSFVHGGQVFSFKNEKELSIEQELLTNIAYIAELDVFYKIKESSFLKPPALNRLYANNPLYRTAEDGAMKRVKADSFLTSSDECIKVQAITFCPGNDSLIVKDPSGQRAINTWRQSKVALINDDITPYIEHMMMIIPDVVVRERYLDWMAFRVQNRSVKINRALLLIGGHGIGKDTLWEPMRYIFGKYAKDIDNAELKEHYQDWLDDAELVIFQEMKEFANTAGDLENQLKPILAAPPHEIRLRMFGARRKIIPNIVTGIFMSNYRNAMHISEGDRRTDPYLSPVKVPMPEKYFTDLYDWLEDGGNAKIAYFLMNRDVSNFNPKAAAPETAFKKELIRESKSASYQKILSMIEDEEEPFDKDIVELSIVRGYLSAVGCSMTEKGVGAILAEMGFESERKADKRNKNKPNRKKSLWCIRNKSKWGSAPAKDWIAEYLDIPCSGRF